MSNIRINGITIEMKVVPAPVGGMRCG